MEDAPRLPENRCDVVMKGGVTSGVIYPGAVARLMRDFRLISVGGTSAGAIAAAAAAAAEYGRQNAQAARKEVPRFPSGPQGLDAIADWVGELAPGGSQTNTRRLFQPQPETRALLKAFLAIVGGGSRRKVVEGVAGALLAGWRQWALRPVTGLTVVLIAAIAWGFGHTGIYAGAALVVGVLLAVTSVVVAAISELPSVVARNHFGLCTGMGDEGALAPWLDATLNDLAGLPDGARPLTFGDLWSAGSSRPRPTRPTRESGPGDQTSGVHLELFTTCLSLLRPLRLPLQISAQPAPEPGELRFSFFFIPDELAAFMPPEVVEWMKTASPDPAEDGDPAAHWSMPFPSDLPVVFATRLSLSVPPLMSGVPLWVRDNRAPTADLQRCWFTDGGLSSNFPLQFFDHAIPHWPTFAIDLTGLETSQDHPVTASAFATSTDVVDDGIVLEEAASDPDRSSERRKVWLATIPTDLPPVQLAEWERRPIGFFTSMLDAMRGWRDRLYSEMPGFCERIVHVGQSAEEGGFNLDMPPETVKVLAARGRLAGELLCDRYAAGGDPRANVWRRHYWTRYRTGMGATTEWLQAFARGARLENSNEPVQNWRAMVGDGPGITPPDFKVVEGGAALLDRTQTLADLGAVAAVGPTGDENGPRPRADLRISPWA